jgi:alpha-mannosidase
VKGLNPRSTWVPVAAPADGGESVDLLIETAANPIITLPVTDLGDLSTAGNTPAYVVGDVRIVVLDEQVRDLVRDLEVLQQLMLELPAREGRRWDIT